MPDLNLSWLILLRLGECFSITIFLSTPTSLGLTQDSLNLMFLISFHLTFVGKNVRLITDNSPVFCIIFLFFND